MTADLDRALADFRVQGAIEWLADPHANARAYNAELAAAGRRPMDDTYPYAMGEARSIIAALLDVLGAKQHGPSRFDCEWALTHPHDPADDEDDDAHPLTEDILDSAVTR